MRPSRSPFLLLALLAAACSEPPPVTPAGPDASAPREEACADQKDDDQDGKTDCDDSDCSQYADCPLPCHKQSECGDVVNNFTALVCLGGKCVAPGEHTLKQQPVTAEIFFDLIFKSTLTGSMKPKVAVLHFLYPTKVDGTPTSCAELIALGNCKDSSTRSNIDRAADLNQVFRNLYNLDFTTCATECTFKNMVATVPKGEDYILYGEAWYGPRDPEDKNNPSGVCAAKVCVEAQSVSASDAHYRLTFQ